MSYGKGKKRKYFDIRKRLRQRDLISPYLFVLCMDKLSHMICDKNEGGNWIGMQFGKLGPSISLLMFVYDILLFGKATEKHMECTTKFMLKLWSKYHSRKVLYHLL